MASSDEEEQTAAGQVPSLLTLTVAMAVRLGITGDRLKDNSFPDSVAELVETERVRLLRSLSAGLQQERRWTSLAMQERAAATTIGWDERSWDDGAPPAMPHRLGQAWAELDQDVQAAALLLGYSADEDSEHFWDNFSCDSWWRGQSALCRAAESGDVAVVRLLLERGDTVNFQGSETGEDNHERRACTETPLHCAVRSGNTEVVSLLVNAKAELDTSAIESGSLEPLSMEHAHYGPLGGVEPIFLATTDDMLKLLVTHGASVNCKTSIDDAHGYCYDLTPLHLACAAGDVPGMKILIDAKADVNAMCATEPSWDDSAYSPLHLAITTPAEVEWPWPTVECNLEAVRTLVMAGADVEAGNISGCGTPLDYAVGWDCVPIVKLLLVAGANPGGGKPENDGFRCTPLHTVIAHIKNMFARKRQAWDELEQDVQAAAISKFMDGISDLFEIGRLLIVAGAPLEVRAESALFHSECGMPGPSMTPLMLAEHLRAQHSAAGDPSAADKDENMARDSVRVSILSALEALIGLMRSIRVAPAAASSTAATEDKPKGKRQRAEY